MPSTLRDSGERAGGHRDEECLTHRRFSLFSLSSCALLRLHQRLPRHGERHRDGDRDAGFAAASRRRSIRRPNLLGAIVTTQLLHAEVANTVGSLVAPAGGVAMSMLIAVLFGAITWNLFTWRAGLPSSSSHALIGALIGMGLTAYGSTRCSGKRSIRSL